MKYHLTQFSDSQTRLLFAHIVGHQCGGNSNRNRDISFWQFFLHSTGSEPKQIGPAYPTKESLLADMPRFAALVGF